ncbi:hypothetical protein ABW286_05090 [Erwinia papayae]|uniref:Uncharacterized protein n=1 Tax=Erwinia papayae TaxID=206499 RepID=A0ABV3MYB4_9GAMM
MNDLTDLLSCKIALAKAEGDLLIIASHRRLGLNTDIDGDGFSYYMWELAEVASNMAKLSARKLVPATWKPFFEFLCNIAKNIDEQAWAFFFKRALKDEENQVNEKLYMD